MSTTYSSIPGDSFDLIARKVYGSEAKAGDLIRANPGVAEPIPTGTILVVPQAPTSAPTATSEDIDELTLWIEGRRFRFWSEIAISKSIDSLSTVSVSAPFEPSSAAFRETFRPVSFKPLAALLGGDLLFTGTLVSALPPVSATQNSISAQGYALPGVLQDCTAPASLFPLEFNNQPLDQITERLCRPFGVSVTFDADPGPVFERVACGPGKPIFPFLAELAKQRGGVFRDSENGNLVYLKSADSGPIVAKLETGKGPLLEVTPTISPQQYYSHITGLAPVSPGLTGAQFTVKNPRAVGILRPTTYTAKDASDANLKQAVEAKAGRMFANMVSYSIKVDTWRDANGAVWVPNTFVSLLAPRAMIYSPYTFLIRSVTLNATSNARTATLDLVLPGAFSGKIPEALPWDE